MQPRKPSQEENGAAITETTTPPIKTENNENENDVTTTTVVRTSERIRKMPGGGLGYHHHHHHPYYSKSSPAAAAAAFQKARKKVRRRKKVKTRTAAAHIAKQFMSGSGNNNRNGGRKGGGGPGRHPKAGNNSKSVSNFDESHLRRSTRKRRAVHRDGYTDSSGSDEDLMKPRRYRTRTHIDDPDGHNVLSTPKRRKVIVSKSTPRREGLRPRRPSRDFTPGDFVSDDEEGTSEEKDYQDDVENGNGGEDNDDEVEGDDEGEGEGDGERDEEGEGLDEGEEDGDDEEGEDEQDGRRRYDLRNRAEVRRLSTEEAKQRPRSPRRVLHQGMGTKVNRDVRKGGPRVHKRHRFARIEDSDDSLLVDELDQGPSIPWARSGSRSGAPWLLGGLDMPGATSWGLNVAASGWGHQNDPHATLTSGVQTAGPSSKGGADIQPLQVDYNVSFDDIGGLSGYIDALKEMVFFPLLYPDFFASYNITPPRGVLLCGPPGTGKTLIARALACAASKAGQKVSFYMRKGADVLSKWVGEAERQLKLLFEEAQKNQPSIIFFDEIDGLAPVRSSKQEQIHNSIVSTLLALMDGLDSRGQVVLIGATNRIDAIDGALRRPGRFDREFNFPLPGCEARAEIIDIHTRKWKHPPSKDLRSELAASCVGYCGADLKALCTEAAIRAFREKYPQVYTSDDKFVIDVDSVIVEKFHFYDAMSTITPAAHRGSIVHSRPLSSVVAPCLQRHLQKVMAYIFDIFPASALSSELTKLSMLSYGSTISLVYRPRYLLHGSEAVGLDHLGPAVLHELEKFPVHSLGLPSLLSDPSAKTPEEALVHIFGEARRTTPSILYLPHFDLWWGNAHEQLRAVLLTLLEDLPSESPILLLATCSEVPSDVDERHQIFTDRCIYNMDGPTIEDRSLYFDRLIEACLSIQSEAELKESHTASLSDLPKAPKVESGPKISELKAKVEAEQHALRRLRMCLRDVCNRLLYDKRFTAFHYPVTDEDAPNYRSIIQSPMDVATLLQHVDSGQYITCSAFLQDVDLILSNAKVYNGDDYNGARIVSRAYELRDTVHGMLSQMDPSLVAFCDKIAAQGGPSQMPSGYGGPSLHQAPVVQSVHMTRTSARLRNVQPEVNLDHRFEVLKRSKRNTDAVPTVAPSEEKSRQEEPTAPVLPEEPPANSMPQVGQGSPSAEGTEHEVPVEAEEHGCGRGLPDDIVMAEGDTSSCQVETIKQRFLDCTEGYGIPQLEKLYTRIIKGVFTVKKDGGSDNTKSAVLQFLSKFSQDETNF